jgi:putative transposase
MVNDILGRSLPAGEPRAERLPRARGKRDLHKRRYKVTTAALRSLLMAQNLQPSNLTPPVPNRVWTTGLICTSAGERRLYLAVVLDLFNREVVGWSVQPRMTADIVVHALTMAWFRRRPGPGLIHHADRAGRYATPDADIADPLENVAVSCNQSRRLATRGYQ